MTAPAGPPRRSSLGILFLIVFTELLGLGIVIPLLPRNGETLGATPAQKENLAALIHLCGAGTANGYARRGLVLSPGLRCGDHDAAHYIARVNAMKREFVALAARS